MVGVAADSPTILFIRENVMALIDLLKDQKRIEKAAGGIQFSLITLINKFLYNEEVAFLKGTKSEVDVRKEEARIELQLAKRKKRNYSAKKADYRDKYIHPSSVATCARKYFYKYFEAPKNLVLPQGVDETAKSKRIFSNGDYMHLRFQVLFVRMGLCTLKDIEVPFTVGDQQGTCDAIITYKGKRYIVDFKSINDYMFKTLERGSHEFLKAYDMQITMYMKHLNVHNAILLYENKNNQELHEKFYHYSTKTALGLRKRIKYIQRSVRLIDPPEAEGTDRRKSPCAYCKYTHLCYNKKEDAKWLRKIKKRHSKKTSAF